MTTPIQTAPPAQGSVDLQADANDNKSRRGFALGNQNPDTTGARLGAAVDASSASSTSGMTVTTLTGRNAVRVDQVDVNDGQRHAPAGTQLRAVAAVADSLNQSGDRGPRAGMHQTPAGKNIPSDLPGTVTSFPDMADAPNS